MGKSRTRSGLRIGVIGLGMGRHHVGGFLASRDVEAVYLCDALPERRKEIREKHALTTPEYADYREMIADKRIDAVSICLPNHLHAPAAIAAFQAGKHVLCEKPLATNLADARRMVEAGRKARRVFMVHFNQRFSPEAQFLKRVIDEGQLGDIYVARCGWIRRWGIPGREWFNRKAQSGGGALIDIGVHVLDLALWFMGHPEPLSVSGNTYTHFGPSVDPGFDVDDHAVGFIRFRNGATLSLEASWAGHVEGEAIFFDLRGTRGGARRQGSYQGDYRIFQTVGGTFVDITPRQALDPVPSPQQAFAATILHGKPNLAPGEQGLATQRILDGIYRSAASGREVRLG
jgi:predicted dehydrogenase